MAITLILGVFVLSQAPQDALNAYVPGAALAFRDSGRTFEAVITIGVVVTLLLGVPTTETESV